MITKTAIKGNALTITHGKGSTITVSAGYGRQPIVYNLICAADKKESEAICTKAKTTFEESKGTIKQRLNTVKTALKEFTK